LRHPDIELTHALADQRCKHGKIQIAADYHEVAQAGLTHLPALTQIIGAASMGQNCAHETDPC
jgi:hypothetical protein